MMWCSVMYRNTVMATFNVMVPPIVGESVTVTSPDGKSQDRYVVMRREWLAQRNGGPGIADGIAVALHVRPAPEVE